MPHFFFKRAAKGGRPREGYKKLFFLSGGPGWILDKAFLKLQDLIFQLLVGVCYNLVLHFHNAQQIIHCI